MDYLDAIAISGMMTFIVLFLWAPNNKRSFLWLLGVPVFAAMPGLMNMFLT